MNEDQQIRAKAMELAIRYSALYADHPVRTPAFPRLVDEASWMEYYIRTGEVPKLRAGQIW